MEKRKITHWTEEGVCDGCGEPIMEGDYAFDSPEGAFCCSKRCAGYADQLIRSDHEKRMSNDPTYATWFAS